MGGEYHGCFLVPDKDVADPASRKAGRRARRRGTWCACKDLIVNKYKRTTSQGDWWCTCKGGDALAARRVVHLRGDALADSLIRYASEAAKL